MKIECRCGDEHDFPVPILRPEAAADMGTVHYVTPLPIPDDVQVLGFIAPRPDAFVRLTEDDR